MLVYFKIINDLYFIKHNFLLIIDQEDSENDEEDNVLNYIHNLIPLNRHLKVLFVNLEKDDYLFNYLTLFLNPIKKNLFGDYAFNFSEKADFKFVKEYLANQSEFQGFYIFEKIEINEEQQSQSRLSFNE